MIEAPVAHIIMSSVSVILCIMDCDFLWKVESESGTMLAQDKLLEMADGTAGQLRTE